MMGGWTGTPSTTSWGWRLHASRDEIRAKYRKLIQRIHPDLDGPVAFLPPGPRSVRGGLQSGASCRLRPVAPFEETGGAARGALAPLSGAAQPTIPGDGLSAIRSRRSCWHALPKSGESGHEEGPHAFLCAPVPRPGRGNGRRTLPCSVHRSARTASVSLRSGSSGWSWPRSLASVPVATGFAWRTSGQVWPRLTG